MKILTPTKSYEFGGMSGVSDPTRQDPPSSCPNFTKGEGLSDKAPGLAPDKYDAQRALTDKSKRQIHNFRERN